MTLRLRTFGAVCLERDGTPLTGAPAQHRRLALLVFLAATGDVPVTRDKLTALLWPELGEQRSRHSLSQLLYALRQQLPPNALLAAAEALRLDASVVPSDVRQFNDAIRAGDDEGAVALYRGPFLDGFFVDDAPEFERWAETERTRLSAQCTAALARLADEASAAGDTFRAMEWCQRLVSLDPADVRHVLRCMRAALTLGDRNGALRQARSYEEYMRTELGDEPDAAVTTLARELREAVQAAPVLTEVAHAPAASMARGERAGADTVQDVAERVPTRPPWRQRRRSMIAALVTVVAALLIMVSVQARQGEGVGAKPVTVLIGDLEGPDSVLSLAMREALRAELAAAPGVTQISDLRAQALRSLAGAAVGTPLMPPLLMDVAMRGGAHIVLTGSASPLGNGTQLLIELIDPWSGEALKTLSVRAADEGAVLSAIAAIGRSLRSVIAEIPVDTTVQALPAVTTFSLPALRSYAQARRAAALGQRGNAIQHAKRALQHDSLFALAHHLAGDQLWFIDRQTDSEAHLRRAHALADRIPLRERWVVRARYEHIVMDRPDSALAYWNLLRDATHDDPLVYEGLSWTLRALGRYEEAALAAQTALRLDPSAVTPNVANALFSWLSVGDTTRAFALAEQWPSMMTETRFHAALVRDDIASALQVANEFGPARAARLHELYLIATDLRQARAQLDLLRTRPVGAEFPRAHLLHGGMELCVNGDRSAAAQHARAALDWVRERDLSAPALGRLAERIGDLAARAGDLVTVDATIQLIRRTDNGRALPSYVLTQRTLAAARAYARGDMAAAAQLARAARQGEYFSRSLNTIVRLEADARRAIGENAATDSLYQMIETHQIADGDFWTWTVLRATMRRCGQSDGAR